MTVASRQAAPNVPTSPEHAHLATDEAILLPVQQHQYRPQEEAQKLLQNQFRWLDVLSSQDGDVGMHQTAQERLHRWFCVGEALGYVYGG